MSRPARAGSAGKPVTIRATAQERERWVDCAEFVSIPLSDWLRKAADRYAEACERNFNFPRKRKPAVMRARSGR